MFFPIGVKALKIQYTLEEMIPTPAPRYYFGFHSLLL